jgi:two-component system nitrogen regulation sensor histidine kinase NtrY
MTFRTRLLVAFLVAVLLPMIALALFIRDEMTDRLTAQYERRVGSLITVIEEDLAEERDAITASLAVIRASVVDDNRFRRAAVDRVQEERRYLLDYAGGSMRLTGLSMLQIQNEAGRIISSGHFRNEYDRLEPELPELLSATPDGSALVRARAPDAPFLALARVDSFQMAGRRFTIVAGVEVGRRFLDRLARGDEMTVVLVYPGGVLSSGADGMEPNADASQANMDVPRTGSAAPRSVAKAPRESAPAGEIVRELQVPFIDSERGEPAEARFRVTHTLAGLHALRGSIDRWFLAAVAAAAVLAVVLVSWLASRISRPLVELADKTSRIDLDRLDIDFETSRKDEIGALSSLLGVMTERLRASTVRIKDAERRATVGELARQVNHDIKNGLTPIRNVFRHLIELLRDEPERLPEVFRERQGTLDSSISYLENLASNYARLYPQSERRPCDVNEIVRRVVMDLRGPDHVDLQMDLGDGINVLGDPVSLRRVLENLAVNGIDALESRPGSVTIKTVRISGESGGEHVSGEGGEALVRITVADTGAGMSERQREKIFDDFYTTKENGTGLGLSIVRRLVMDLGGTIRVESEEGMGSSFIIELPGAGAE